MIGIFDSGYGGLTIYKEIVHQLPEYDYVYLGDNARAPYGNRSHDTIKEFTKESVDYLLDIGCKLIIFACNTASSQVLREIQEEYLRKPGITNRKILGVIRPLVEEAVNITKNRNVGIVGTRSTISADSYATEIKALNSGIKVHSQACPLLVPLIEENWHKKPEAKMILKKYLMPLKSRNVDTLILACTHYPFLIKEFQKYMGKKVRVPHPGKIVAASLKNYLQRHPEIETLLSKKGTRTFLTTDDPSRFKEFGNKFVSANIDEVKKIHLPLKK
jgi:glutamate racemase